MEELFSSYSYPSLFFISFLAATVLPLGSEWFLTVMIVGGDSPVLLVLVATIGNYLGACTTYLIGIYGGPFLLERVLRIDQKAHDKAIDRYRRYGSWSLLFSWLPIVGDPLCFTAGVFRTGFSRFSLLVLLAKLGRYTSVAVLTMLGLRVIS
jgi:membrane protein YqaA with SNARE-associated domain